MSVQEFVGDSLSPIQECIREEPGETEYYYWMTHLTWHLETTVDRLHELVEASDEEMFRGVADVMEGCFRSLLSRSVVSTAPEKIVDEVDELQALLSDLATNSDSDLEDDFQSVLSQVEAVSEAFNSRSS